MSEVKLTNTPYDDVFRTLLNDCSSLIIPVINEVFHERYSGKEKVVFSANFKIVGTKIKKYHLECQSTIDNSILVRMFEYGTQIALDEGEIKENVLTVTFPHSAVLYLRCSESTPDKMKIKMVTPGGEVAYDIPLMKSQQYTIEEIF